MRICIVDGCERKHIAKGMCTKHYRRVEKHGNPHTVLPPSGGSPAGPGHPRWKGREITYGSAHFRVYSHRGPAKCHQCECGAQAQEWAYDHSDPSPLMGLSRGHKVLYSPDVDRYRPMCGPCHRKFDLEAGQVPA